MEQQTADMFGVRERTFVILGAGQGIGHAAATVFAAAEFPGKSRLVRRNDPAKSERMPQSTCEAIDHQCAQPPSRAVCADR